MRKILLTFILSVLILILAAAPVNAVNINQVPYTTYTYSYANQDEQISTQAYIPSNVIYGEDLGTAAFKNPEDIFISDVNGCYYISDTGNDRVLTVNFENKCINELKEFENNGNLDSLSEPKGVYTDKNGFLFVADFGNNRLLKFDKQYKLIKEYTKPNSTLFGEDTVFKPISVAVADEGNIYVICDGVYQGIVEIDENGEFVGFIGANKTNPSLWDRFWLSVSTEKQRENMQSFIPVTFTGMDLDDVNFLLATSQLENNLSNSGVKRINLGGIDVIKTNSEISMMGDIRNYNSGTIIGRSSFNDICYVSDGVFAVTDIMRSKVFFYSEDGDLLFAFGSNGSQLGNMMSPSGIDANGLTLYIVDSASNQITVFEPTSYCKTMFNAIKNYREGNYELSDKYFNQLLKQNSNCELAYIGMGKAQVRNGEYRAAMQSFKLANNKEYYSTALKGYRGQIIEKIFIPLFISLIVLAVVLIVHSVIKKRHKKPNTDNSQKAYWLLDDIEHGFYLILHPFKGYSDIKYEGSGSLAAGFIFFVAYFISMLFKSFSTGFLFLGGTENQVNLIFEFTKAVAPIFLFCLANWCLTTLMDGEGSFSLIIESVLYALTPLIISNILCTALSQVLVNEEAGFYYVVSVIGYVWCFALIAIGNLSIHNFTMSRTVLTLILTVIAIAIIVFIGFLFVNLSCEVYYFAKEVILEVINR